jgi:mRNA interferase MazF
MRNLTHLKVRPLRKHGEVWLANLNPSRGTETGKVRPVLIVQAQALLDAQHPSTLVVPLTTHLIDNMQPLRIRISAVNRLEKNSDLLLDQLRSIDNRRFLEGPLIHCDSAFMTQVHASIRDLIEN